MSSAVKKAHHAESRRAHPASAKCSPPTLQPVRVTPASRTEWNYLLACEARNALQVLLSGGEILLDDELGTLTSEQRGLLAKMMDGVRHVNRLIATLRESDHANLPEPLPLSLDVKSYIGGDRY